MSSRVHAPSAENNLTDQSGNQVGSFFLNRNNTSDGNVAVIEFTDRAPDLPITNTLLHRRLAAEILPQIARNDTNIVSGWYNNHDHRHQARVASVAVQLGHELGYSEHELSAAYLGGRFHDAEYKFPDDFRKMATDGKVDAWDFGHPRQGRHPEDGGNAITWRIKNLLNFEDVRREVLWWNGKDDATATKAGVYHSNGAAYHPDNVNLLDKFTRMADKLDATSTRICPEHLDAYRALTHGASLDDVRKRVHAGAEILASPLVTGMAETEDEWRERLEESNPGFYQHQLVPACIVDQVLHFDRATGEFVMMYAVDPRRVASKLGVDYEADTFLADFESAYGAGSMPRAAEVAHSVQTRRFGKEFEDGESTFTVQFHFADGSMVEKQYAPRFS